MKAATILFCVIFLQACRKTTDADTATLVTVQAQQPEIGPISEHITAVASALASASTSSVAARKSPVRMCAA